jgi:hypothetical protein
VTLPYVVSKSTSLREAGYNEAWLQQLIQSDPSVLGLGDLKSFAREVRQSSGGRLDFLLTDPDSEVMYEVEIMLGATDESHIIRTLEYWDIESRRWPAREHRAVIVAEEITNRFFNVIWLLNRSIPIIAIKLDALEIDGKMTLSFTKVLDIFETPEGREQVPPATTTRQTWVDYSKPESFAVFEKIVELVSSSGKKPRITYNVDHIAIGGTKKNFAWLSPRGKSLHCMVELRVGEPDLDPLLKKLGDSGVDAYRFSSGTIRMRLTIVELSEKTDVIKEALDCAIRDGGGL